MLDLKQGECRGWNMKVAEQRFFFQGFKQVRNIVYIAYAVVWSSKPEQGSKYNIPYLKVPLEAFFPTFFEQTKKFSSFGKGTARWMFCIHLCRNHFLWAYNRGPIKNSTLGYFCKSTYRQMYRKLQRWWQFGR